MLRGLFIFYVMMVFFLGFATHAAITFTFDAEATPVAQPLRGTIDLQGPVNLIPEEKASPYDWIKEDNIRLYPDRVVIDVNNPQWSTYTDTNSMDPILDETAHGIQIVPQTESDIHVGDIISYEPENFDGILIHRVVEIGEDKEGWYARVQGDNNPYPDPAPVRFDQIRRILVMIIY